MHAPTLGLSLLGNEVKAISFRKGLPVAPWESAKSGDPTEDFVSYLRDFLSKTQSDGREVALVLAHARLNDQVIEIPQASGWILERILERQAQNCKTFPGAAAWSWQPALPTKKANAVLLHLLPKTTLDQLSDACQQAHLRLVRVLPTSAVLIAQLKALPLEKDEIALLAAETGTSTTIVIGRKDGRVAVGRVLANSWSTSPDRVWVDLTRSIGFAEQQCGGTVSSVWLFGPTAKDHVEVVQSILKLPVRLSPTEYTPYYWAEQAARLPDKSDGSFISLEVRQAPQRRKILAATLFILLIFAVLSLGAAGTLEVVRKLELNSGREIDRVIAKLQDRKAEWQRKYAEAARKKELVRILTDRPLPPVPAWFLAYLGEVLPDDLVLRELRVFHTNDNWSLRLAGIVDRDVVSTHLTSTNHSAESFASLTNQLATGPFRIQITRGAFGASVDSPSPVRGAGSGLRRVVPADATQGSGLPDRFSIEGMIR